MLFDGLDLNVRLIELIVLRLGEKQGLSDGLIVGLEGTVNDARGAVSTTGPAHDQTVRKIDDVLQLLRVQRDIVGERESDGEFIEGKDAACQLTLSAVDVIVDHIQRYLCCLVSHIRQVRRENSDGIDGLVHVLDVVMCHFPFQVVFNR